MRAITASLGILLLATPALTTADEQSAGQSVAEQYQKLVDQYEDEGGAREFAPRFFQLAEEYPKDPIAVKALMWVATKLKNRPEAARALESIEKNHLHSEKLGASCLRISMTPSTAAEKLLRALIDRSPHRQVRAQACFYLSTALEQKAGVVDQLKAQPELAGRVLQYYGKDYGQHLAALDPAALAKQREENYERMLKSFADVPRGSETMGEIANKALFRLRHLSIGKLAPEIEGEDIDGIEFKLSDYRGRVVMLSFWGHW